MTAGLQDPGRFFFPHSRRHRRGRRASEFAPAMTWMRWAWVLAVLHILIKGANPLELKCGADHNCNMLPDMADPANLRHLKCVPATPEMVALAPPLGGLTLGRGVAQTGAGRASSPPCSSLMR